MSIPKSIYCIFEKFNLVEDRLRKSSEGSGLGLSLVKKLVEIQGGKIEFSDTKDAIKSGENLIRSFIFYHIL